MSVSKPFAVAALFANVTVAAEPAGFVSAARTITAEEVVCPELEEAVNPIV
jgi:hypothetical protein